MPISPDFKFAGSPAFQAEAERRAAIMFGENWRSACSQAKDRGGARAIAANDNLMSFDDVQIRSWKHNKLHDLADGSPALCKYHTSGHVALHIHYIGGHINDPAPGVHAFVEYYPSGRVKETSHYINDGYLDPQDGSPARINYSESGCIIGGWAASVGKLDALEVEQMLKAVQLCRVADLLAKADQSVVPAGMPLPRKCERPRDASPSPYL